MEQLPSPILVELLELLKDMQTDWTTADGDIGSIQSLASAIHPQDLSSCYQSASLIPVLNSIFETQSDTKQWSFLAIQGQEPASLFVCSDSTLCTKGRIIPKLRSALQAAGLVGPHLAQHSFRINSRKHHSETLHRRLDH